MVAQKRLPSYDVQIVKYLGQGAELNYFHCGLFNRYNLGKDYLLFRDSNGQSILPEDDPKSYQIAYLRHQVRERGNKTSSYLKLSVTISLSCVD